MGGKVGDRNVPAPLSLFFDDLVYAEGEGALPGPFRRLHTDIHGSWEFPDLS